MNTKVHYWIDLAEYDLEAAKVMLKGKMFLYVGFMCHQVIEKTLKGYYVYSLGITPPTIHNLLKLATDSGIYDLLSDDHKKLLGTLMSLNIQARYPTEKERILKSLSYEKCRDLIDKTKELSLWIKARLSTE